MPITQEPISEFSVNLGKKIREARQRYELSILALSRECGVSTGHLCDIERGLAVPGADKLAKIAKRLKLNVSRLLAIS